jgi:cobalt/nickel transport system permease protein
MFLLVIAFILSVSLLPEGAFLALAAAWLTLAAVSLFARIGPLPMLRGAFIALPFAIAAFPLIFTRPGRPIADLDLGLFTLTLSGEGLIAFATILLKSWVSVQAAALLVFTTPFHDLLEGLERLRLPRLMVAIVALMYRYLAVLTGEASRMMRARASRAAVPPGRKPPHWTWQGRVVGNMVGALFIRAYERSERVYLAMQSRGYAGHLRHLHDRPFPRPQLALLLIAVAGLAAFELSAHTWVPRP